MFKRIVLLASFIFLTVVIYNCDDAGLVETDTGFEVTGSVPGWTQGTKILKALVYDNTFTKLYIADSTTIESNGSFKVEIGDPPDSVKYGFIVYPLGDTGCSNNVVVSPSGLKVTVVQFNVYDQNNLYVGRLIKAFQYPPMLGSFIVGYSYFNEAGTVNGDKVCISGADTSKFSYNLNGTKGWNKTVNYFNANPIVKTDVTISNTEPVGADWMMIP